MQDRQTVSQWNGLDFDSPDNTHRGFWWFLTAYHEDISFLEDNQNYPSFVKAVYGGQEKCPTTGTIHFQGLLNTGQVRFSTVKNWLTKTKIMIPRDLIACKRYVMKRETSVGDKQVRQPIRAYLKFSDALRIIAKYNMLSVTQLSDIAPLLSCDPESQFWKATKMHILEYPDDISLFSNPQLIRAWKYTRDSWFTLVFHEQSKSAVEINEVV